MLWKSQERGLQHHLERDLDDYHEMMMMAMMAMMMDDHHEMMMMTMMMAMMAMIRIEQLR